MKIQENVKLAQYTTFKIGGPAEYFVEAKEISDVQEALTWAKEKNMPCKVIGGGSNMLISDAGLNGLVVRMVLNKLEFNGNKVAVGPGVILALLVNKSLQNNFTGMEFAAGIPGTVGGAIRGNAGTYGVAMDSIVRKVKYLDENFLLKQLSNEEADFAYRHSIFKEKPWIIVEAELELANGDVEASRKIIQERLQYRQDTQPNLPSAGCIFKNIRFEDVDIESLATKNIEIEKFSKFKKIPSAYIIEKTGLKGYKIGDAQVSEVHANYIVNLGEATAEQVVMLISFVKQQVRDKYGIQLQEEVQLLL